MSAAVEDIGISTEGIEEELAHGEERQGDKNRGGSGYSVNTSETFELNIAV